MMNKLKVITILGPGLTNSQGKGLINQIKEIHDKPEYLLIGDGIKDIDFDEIFALKGRIDLHTRINLQLHGAIIDEYHVISHKKHDYIFTSEFLYFLKMISSGNPLYVNLRSCFGGGALKEVLNLGEGSILITHAAADDSVLMDLQWLCIYGIMSKMENWGDSPSHFQKVLNELTINSRLPVLLSTYANGETYEFKINYDLEEYLTDPIKLLTESQGNFEKFYQKIYPNSEKLLIPQLEFNEEFEHYKHGLLTFKVGSKSQENKEQAISLLQNEEKRALYEKLLNFKIGDNLTPLYAASSLNNLYIVKLLLNSGANINEPTSDGLTPLYIASQEGNTEIVKLLLDNKADFNQVTLEGNTPLYIASRVGNTEIVKILLDKGANLEQANSVGRTPLLTSSSHGHLETTKLLLKYGADIFSKKYQDSIAYHWVLSWDNKDIIQIFEDEIKDRKLIRDQLPTLPLSSVESYLADHQDEVYTSKRCVIDDTAIYKFHSMFDETLICKNSNQPQFSYDEL